MTTTFQSVLAAVIVTASVVVAVAASAMNTDAGKTDLLAPPTTASGYVTIATPSAEVTILTRVHP